jgi:hypothetical protein
MLLFTNRINEDQLTLAHFPAQLHRRLRVLDRVWQVFPLTIAPPNLSQKCCTYGLNTIFTHSAETMGPNKNSATVTILWRMLFTLQ